MAEVRASVWVNGQEDDASCRLCAREVCVYMFVCVCVCVHGCGVFVARCLDIHACVLHTHTHTHVEGVERL